MEWLTNNRNSGKKKNYIGLIVCAASFAAGGVSAHLGQRYLVSLLFGFAVGAVTGLGYNMFAKMNNRWPMLKFSDVLSWIYPW